MSCSHTIRSFTVAGLLLLLAAICSPRASGKEQEVLTNDSVVQLVNLGLPDEVIVKKIRASTADFDLTVTGLAALKKAGVSGDVIATMLDASGSLAVEAATDASLGSSPDAGAPLAITDPGLYVERTENGETHIRRLDPSVFTQAKTAGIVKSAFTAGISKIKLKMVLPGPSARLQIPNRKPTFYFYLGEVSGSFGAQAQGPTTANEFVLARFEVRSKKGRAHRELVVAKAGVTGVRTGALEETVHAFESEALSPGLFRVWPRTELRPGEYVFYWAGTEEGGNVFDFGIR